MHKISRLIGTNYIKIKFIVTKEKNRQLELSRATEVRSIKISQNPID